MAQNFLSARNLPQFDCTRQNIYDLIEQMAPLAALLDSRILQVVANQIAPANGLPFWRKYTVGHAALQTAATVNDIQLFSLEAGGIIHALKLKHSTAFAGGSISAYTLSVGITGLLDKYLKAFDVFAAVSGTNLMYRAIGSPLAGTLGNTDGEISGVTIGGTYSQSEVQNLRTKCEELADDVRNLRDNSYGSMVGSAAVTGHESHTAATSIRLAATSTGANLNASTAGSVDVWALVSIAT